MYEVSCISIIILAFIWLILETKCLTVRLQQYSKPIKPIKVGSFADVRYLTAVIIGVLSFVVIDNIVTSVLSLKEYQNDFDDKESDYEVRS